ncbi:SURP and G-patch domain-containing protein 1 isoform X1 [Schistocerca americana]|uniref:SURP and G-patch domain-containing protein 1 isoform X1 n=1 Tax=Schistocerca americana TaxID=7009 RepID=UPI001F4FB2E2|nr:SURP and G-patch domain-containing protein 1 isoform X1 [Schistocerca americana]
MAYRGIKVPDPFTSKTTRNERFAQMSKQEQLIEQKKREIQAKLEEQKKKEADEALKKLHGVSGSGKAGANNKVSAAASLNKSSQKQSAKSNLDSRWKKEQSHTDRNSSQQKTSGALNIFSNDGSFLDQFKKMSGVKEGKQRREDAVSSIIDIKNTPQATDTHASDKRDRETIDRHERSERSRNNSGWESWQSHQVRPSSPCSPTRGTSPVSDFSQPPPPPVQQAQPLQQMQIPTLPLTMAHCLTAVEHPPQLVQTPAPPLVSPEAAPALVLAPQSHSVTSVAAPVSGAPNIAPLGITPSVPPPTVVLSHPPPMAPQYMQYPPPPPAPVQLQTLPPTVQTPAAASLPVQGPPPPQTLLVPPPQLVSLQQQPPPTSAPMPHLVAAAQPPPTGVSSAAEPHVPSTEESMREVARMVAQCGDDIEEIIKIRNPDDQSVWFLRDKTDTAYMQYRCLVEKFKSEMEEERKRENNEPKVKTEVDTDNSRDSVKTEPSEADNRVAESTVKQEQLDDENSCASEGRKSGDESDSSRRKRKRRSRWAPETEKVEIAPPVTQAITGTSPLLTKISRNHPALIQYAVQAFGTSSLSEEDWKKAEDHYKINLLYQDMLRKRQEIERLARAGKFKYEYDSDEETDGGTWEHRLRMAEMEATQLWAEELTKKAEGKHHIGDFLPPDELERFMEKFQALKEGREPDLSDYKEYKLKEDNIGFQMLQKLGWTEGQGLGSDGTGIVDPVNKATTRPENHGLGLERPEDVSKGDDEYDAYRKRMMLAYRFRPNPLNNPRRPYY